MMKFSPSITEHYKIDDLIEEEGSPSGSGKPRADQFIPLLKFAHYKNVWEVKFSTDLLVRTVSQEAQVKSLLPEIDEKNRNCNSINISDLRYAREISSPSLLFSSIWNVIIFTYLNFWLSSHDADHNNFKYLLILTAVMQ